MNTAPLTPRALDVIADSGETGEIVFGRKEPPAPAAQSQGDKSHE